MRCESCGVKNQAGAKFCFDCGAELTKSCPNCGQNMQATANFCDACGSKLSERIEIDIPRAEGLAPIDYTPRHLVERILAEHKDDKTVKGAQGERKVITALFADLVDSTELVNNLDPEDACHLIDPVIALMMESVHHYEGYVAKTLGDGILALFGVPIGHEDHPQRALFAALRIQQTIQNYADKFYNDKGVLLQVRIGIHTGTVAVRSVRTEDLHVDYEPIGHSINLASRLESIASPGSIVVSEDTYKLALGFFTFKSLGKKRLKGVAKLINAYEVLESRPFQTRLQVAAKSGLVRFVGRQSELTALTKAFKKTKDSGGQVIAVVGEAGVGKSRLFHEFKQLFQSECLQLEAFSVSYGKAYAYLPLIKLLKHYFNILPLDDEKQKLEKVTDKVLGLDKQLKDCLPYFFYLLGIYDPSLTLAQMNSDLRRLRIFESIKKLFVHENLKQPIILIFEDLHWIDNETELFFRYLADGIQHTHILMLVNYRPEYLPKWCHSLHFSQIRLHSFNEIESTELLDTLLGNDKSLVSIKSRLMEETEGNPFFLEEVIQGLHEEHILEGVRGHYHLTKEIDRLHIPTTVQGVLCSRIDRLQQDEKELLQVLSVIGKSFSWSLVKKVVNENSDRLQELLYNLQTGEFIYQRLAFPEIEYTFKHALIQEVAYGSMLKKKLKLLHERIAAAIEILFEGRLENYFKQLAYHYQCSGNKEKAIMYLYEAGQQAMKQSTTIEAIRHFNAALELNRCMPYCSKQEQQELAIKLSMATAQVESQGYAARIVKDTLTHALNLCRKVGNNDQLFRILLGLRNFHQVRGELLQARELSVRLIQLAQDEHNESLLMEAHRAMGSTCLPLGELGLAREHLERVVSIYNPAKHRSHILLYGLEPGVFSMGYLAWALWHLGYPDQALKKVKEANSLAQKLGFPFAITHAYVLAAELHIHRGEGKQAQELAEAAFSLAIEHGYSYWSAWAKILQGAALAEQKQYDEGIVGILSGLEAYKKTGSALWQSHFVALLADAYNQSGQAAKGMQVLAQEWDTKVAHEERLYDSEIIKLEADLSISTAPNTKIELVSDLENRLKKAIVIAGQQSSRSLELRANISLCRLWMHQGKTKEAQVNLIRLCNDMKEGRGTSDSMVARTLLAKLNTVHYQSEQ
ncbi:adenylate/guanylate cyclase domain-containing protein [Amphritea sp. HPY]|uniref:adenylate/guanylate cyclase domain-containing protein n=1 Tax=Amphritea sp. HPY TaxID=3421652 RepID=UPI003D7D274E